jgi:hypothetical protein
MKQKPTSLPLTFEEFANRAIAFVYLDTITLGKWTIIARDSVRLDHAHSSVNPVGNPDIH